MWQCCFHLILLEFTQSLKIKLSHLYIKMGRMGHYIGLKVQGHGILVPRWYMAPGSWTSGWNTMAFASVEQFLIRTKIRTVISRWLLSTSETLEGRAQCLHVQEDPARNNFAQKRKFHCQVNQGKSKINCILPVSNPQKTMKNRVLYNG